jgi:hypothetical protein
MPLKSQALSADPRLERCLVDDTAHLTPGVQGAFVGKVQAALMFLDGLEIADDELDSETYGPSTADAVLAYKTAREIINRSYQNTPDNIVGRMTIKSLDDEMAVAENTPDLEAVSPFCLRDVILAGQG